uniref:DNA polymerase n=1 Tax=Blastobotrys adeninivorans TaxID=409370 RepID=A0A060T9I9_BLAAD
MVKATYKWYKCYNHIGCSLIHLPNKSFWLSPRQIPASRIAATSLRQPVAACFFNSYVRTMATIAKRTRSGDGPGVGLKQAKLSDTMSPSSKSSRASDKKSGLFAGLNFIFIPRRTASTNLVKTKAEIFAKHGAQIINKRQLKSDLSNLTHVIVTDKRSEREVLDDLGVDELPKGIVVVHDDWPSVCIEQGKLVDTSEYQLVVEDSAKETTKEEPKQEEDNEVESKQKEGKKEEDKEESSKEMEPPSENEVETDVRDAKKPDDEQFVPELVEAIDAAKYHDEAAAYLSDGEDESGSKVKKSLKGDWWENYLKIREQGNDFHGNDKAIRLFSLMQEHYAAEGDQFRAKAYRQAISTLKKQDKPIRSSSEAVKLPGIGKRLADKIEEIVTTGHLKRLEDAEKDESAKVLSMLTKIYGVGRKTAVKWYSEGTNSLEDAAKRPDITDAQRIGIEHYDDFNDPIPRETVDKHYQVVKDAVANIDPKAEVYCMGSFRRGAKYCGDIDIILTKEGAGNNDLQPILSETLRTLDEKDFVKCTLSGEKDDKSRWYGASAIEEDPTWRRMDILIVPWAELGAALIYYTGNDIFNRSVRLLAAKKGYRLNQHGIYKDPFANTAYGRRPKESPLDLVEASSERKIFDLLGLPYLKPTDRNVG